MKKGLPLGQGLTADIFEWGETEIVKLFKKGYPACLIDDESSICQKVYELGLPVPAYCGSIEIDGRYGLIFERVTGELLPRLMAANPFDLPKYARMMSELHFAIHKHTVPELPFFAARMASAIKGHKTLVPEEKITLLDGLYLRADGILSVMGISTLIIFWFPPADR
ncbi:MAG: phosphotransferase [Thermincola sp.]|nr:phosphotransferase [Thermincola sp.]